MPTVDELRIAFNDAITAGANSAAQSLDRVAASIDKATAAASTQDEIVKKVGRSYDTTSRTISGTATEIAKGEAANRRYDASVQSVLQSQARLGTTNAQVAEEIRRLGLLRDQDLEKARIAGQKIEQQFIPQNTALAASTSRVSFAMRDLGLQSIDVFQGLATGQPVFRTLIQQGAQVYQVNQAMGVSFADMAKGIASTVAGINPFLLAGAAATAVVVGLAAGAESTANRLVNLQNHLRATRDDYTAMAAEATAAAKAIAATTSIGTGDARAAAQAISSSANFAGNQQQLQTLIKLSADLATVQGIAVPDAAKQLQAALENAGKVAQEMADHHLGGPNGINQSLADNVKHFSNAGDNAQAFGLLVAALMGKFDGAHDHMTPLQTALSNLSKAFTEGANGGRSLADSLGTKLTDIAAGAVASITDVVKALEKAFALVNGLNLPEWVKSAITAAGNAAGAAVNPVGAIRDAITGVVNNSGSIGQTGGLRTDLANSIQQIAEASHILPEVADFAQRIVSLGERSPGQFNNQGGVLTSPAGALGLFQVMPDVPGGTTRTVGGQSYDLTQERTNTQAGLAILQELYTQFQGDLSRVAVGYNAGPGVASGRVQQGPRAFAETTGYLQRLGLSDPRGGAITLPDVNVTANRLGAVNASPLDAAQGAYNAAGTLSAQLRANQEAQDKLTAGLAALGPRTETNAKQFDEFTEALTKTRGEATDLITQQQKLGRTAQDNVAPLQAQYGATRTLAEVTNQFVVAARASGRAVDQGQLYQAQTAKLRELSVAFQDNVDATDRSTQAQLAIMAAYDGSQQSLDHATNQQKAYAEAVKDFLPGTAQFADGVDKMTAALDRGSDAQRAFQQQQRAIADVAGAFTSAFDQIGNSITQALVSGQGAAVNWGNTLSAVAQQVLQQFLKLAVLNPILNGLFGQTNTTLGSAIGAIASLGGSGGAQAGTGGSSVFGTVSNLGTLASGANSLTGGWLGNSLGITGPNGLLTQATNYLGLTGGVSVGASSSAAELAAAVSGAQPINAGIFGSGGSIASITNAPILGSTLGMYAGGIGGGFAAGSLVGNLVQGALNKTGPAPMIGAGLGAVAGAGIGTLILPGIGTLVGGVLGGTLGGAGGGLIGPHPASTYSSLPISVDANGLIQGGQFLSQKDPNAEAEKAQAGQDTGTLNSLLLSAGLRISTLGGIRQLGINTPGGYQDPSKASDLASALPNFRFSVNDTSTDLGRALATQITPSTSFGSLDQLQAVFSEVSTFVNSTVPTLKALGDGAKVTGAYADALANLHAQFDPAITEARKLGFAEADLTAARDKALAAASEAVEKQVRLEQTSLQSAYLQAAAQVSGNPADAQTAALYAFDNVQAAQQRQQLQDEYKGIFGDAYATSVEYAQTSTLLEKTLGEQRLAIQRQYNGSITQAAAGIVTSLTAYVQKLQGSDISPLSPLAQYQQAKNQFNAVAGAAQAGDYNSISNLTTYADALISTSRNVNGSGLAYANDYASILKAVGGVANLGPDTLTASVFAAQSQSSTAAIVSSQANLAALLQSILTAINLNSMRPARAA